MPTQPRTRIAAFVSGGGSNFVAVHEHQRERGAAAAGEIVLVVSNKAGCVALTRAADRNVGTVVLAQPADGEALLTELHARGIEVIVLAGYLALVPPAVTRAYRGKIVNVHPSLLPAFGGPGMYGRHVHKAVLAAGARISGATVHFVDEEYDRGAIIAQWPVPVFEEDSPETLAARVLRVEHALLPRVVELLCAESLALDDDGTVHGAFLTGAQADVFSLPVGASLSADLDAALSK
ncbi:MAG TPA: phosphoribosylglycinamide formyltransferase [Gemmatimonadaceae bacterium]|nr:phosphoribosylglycinamide formyltransferase [Gemmatimonadaceae bacterium]